MKVRFSIVVLSCVGLVCGGVLAGCGPQSQEPASQNGEQDGDGGVEQEAVDPHDVPLTEEQKQQLRDETAKFADAVAKVKQLRDTVERETKGGLPENPFEAHQALDKADVVLPWLPEVARDSGIPKEHWETVNTSASELRELFEQVHQNIDNKVDPDFASVAERMDERIEKMETIAASSPAAD